MSKTPFRVRCDSGLANAVAARVAAEMAREKAWWDEELEAVRAIKGQAERQQARGALEAERDRRRQAGEVLGTNDALMTRYLGVVLAAKGWDRKRWPAIPAGVASVGGRPVGVTADSQRAGDGEGWLRFSAPTPLWERVRRAAYWTSEPHVRELQAWADRFGDGIGRGEREGGAALMAAQMQLAFGQGPKADHLRKREDLRKKIITVGDIVRMAAQRATTVL